MLFAMALKTGGLEGRSFIEKNLKTANPYGFASPKNIAFPSRFP
jgi:hypothetical protein